MSLDGKERRDNMSDVALEVRALSERFDNELGAANGSHEGSVKRHLRRIQDDVAAMREVIVGDGKNNIGIVSQIRQNSKELEEHKMWDRWLFGLLISGQVLGIFKLFNG